MASRAGPEISGALGEPKFWALMIIIIINVYIRCQGVLIVHLKI